MPLFADIDATGWTVIIGAVSLGVVQVIREINAARREVAKIARDQQTAQVVQTVKEEAIKARRKADTAAEVSIQSDKKADALGEQMDRVERQTNGLNERLRAERDAERAEKHAERKAHAETQKKLEAALAALPPVPLAEKIDQFTEIVVEASKSGVFKRPAPPKE